MQSFNILSKVAGAALLLLLFVFPKQSLAQWTAISGNIYYNSGNVGIGKTSPVYKLDVLGSVNASSFLINGTPFQPTQWVSSGSTINYNSGTVCIGTTLIPAGYKLAVGGKLITEEIVVKLQPNWPDYVFEQNYKLMPLYDLEAFVARHKHLPEIPSSSDIHKNGLAVGEMNVLLLKKVEELTLHLIDLQRQLDALAKSR